MTNTEILQSTQPDQPEAPPLEDQLKDRYGEDYPKLIKIFGTPEGITEEMPEIIDPSNRKQVRALITVCEAAKITDHSREENESDNEYESRMAQRNNLFSKIENIFLKQNYASGFLKASSQTAIHQSHGNPLRIHGRKRTESYDTSPDK